MGHANEAPAPSSKHLCRKRPGSGSTTNEKMLFDLWGRPMRSQKRFFARWYVNVEGVRRQARTVAPGRAFQIHASTRGNGDGSEPSASAVARGGGDASISEGVTTSCAPSKRDGAATGTTSTRLGQCFLRCQAPVTHDNKGARFVFLELPHSRKHRFRE